ncbi:Glycosyl transferase family 8 [Popillia japonica]|uniref:UDP-D-xylose:beta-D-glucoside alpha-1,3-D-xylosyltransferase n=1 Tax=Popillia japonica TaxID=7064 RepID=A0AAW1LEM3_POPJA
MKTITYCKLCTIFVLIILILYFYKTKNNGSLKATNNLYNELNVKRYNNKRNIVIAVVTCGDRLQETLTMIKSALMFTNSKIHFIILSESQHRNSFNEKLSEWQSLLKDKFTFKVMPLIFPTDNALEWRKLFKPCAAQRLFLPSVLSDIDSVLYVDTDTLFLSPVETVWDHFDLMNSSQIAALAPEHEDPNVGWYNRFARHPYYGKLGVNSGVMLMNLTRMRAFEWVDYVIPIYKRYKLKITWGDQDIINIIFHFHPDKLYIYSCRYNYRPDHCMYMNVCKQAEVQGIIVLHGSRGFFHSEKQPVFQSIYKAFEEFQLGSDLYYDFYMPLETYVELAIETNCGHIKNAYLMNIKKYVDELTRR